MFLSKSYPEGFVPVGVIDMQFLTMAIGEDGTIYTRVKDSNYCLTLVISLTDH